MGTIPLPIPYIDFHRAGHPPAFAYGQPDACPFCAYEDRTRPDMSRVPPLGTPGRRTRLIAQSGTRDANSFGPVA